MDKNTPIINEIGAKLDQTKLDLSLVPGDWDVELARVFTEGCTKYGRDNWRRGFAYSRLFSAIKRHLLAFEKGEDVNIEDGGVYHLAQAAWNCLVLLHQVKNKTGKDNVRFSTNYGGGGDGGGNYWGGGGGGGNGGTSLKK